LVHGGDQDETHGKQHQLSELLSESALEQPFDMTELRAAHKAANRRGAEWAALADDLRAIEQLETLLVPAAAAFAFALNRTGQRLGNVAAEIRKCWGRSLRHLKHEYLNDIKPLVSQGFGDDESAERLTRIATAFALGEYDSALRLLVEHNTHVMQARHGVGAWVVLDGDRLDVRLKDEARGLPTGQELPQLWWNTYFINSLKNVQATLAEAS
jgi:hypothetical protein